jgi:hypothetical protein
MSVPIIRHKTELRDAPFDASLVVFGDSDMDLCSFDAGTRSFRRVDKIAHDRFGTFESFEQMVEVALSARI